MVERALLSKAIVDEAMPPSKGEPWIADTKQRGFGLRLWAGRADGGKAYGVRVAAHDGRMHRRTIGYWELYDRSKSRCWFEGTVTLGDLLEDARSWARDQIDILKGRPTLADEEDWQKATAQRYAATLTLEEATELTLKAMKSRGVSQAHLDDRRGLQGQPGTNCGSKVRAHP